jgi:RimJ/RimL family protein N-acetyltransferase
MPLDGLHVVLREERLIDLPFLVELRNHPATQGWNKSLPPDFTVAMEENRFLDAELSMDRRSGRFIVEEIETEEPVGYIRYSHLEPRWACDIGMAMLEDVWGSGLSHDALETMLKFLFVDLGVRAVRLWTNSGNGRAIGLARAVGFQDAIVVREGNYKSGVLADTLLLDLIREEFFAERPDLIDTLPAMSDAQED